MDSVRASEAWDAGSNPAEETNCYVKEYKMPNLIQEFRGEYGFLSNFYPAKLMWDGWEWPSSEHAYQAAKTKDPDARIDIHLAPTPGKAKELGKIVPRRNDWEDVKLAYMTGIVFAKFNQNEDLCQRLLETGNAWLVEGNSWGDEFWGKCLVKNQGENWLGRILMLVRSRLVLKHNE